MFTGVLCGSDFFGLWVLFLATVECSQCDVSILEGTVRHIDEFYNLLAGSPPY